MNAVALPDLAQAIEREHQAAHSAARTALEHALECGRLLIEAKTDVGHGEWLPWLEANTSVSARQSQNYMRLTRHRAEIEAANAQRDSHLPIRDALALLADHRDQQADDEPAVDAIAAEGMRLALAAHDCSQLRRAVKEHVNDIAECVEAYRASGIPAWQLGDVGRDLKRWQRWLRHREQFEAHIFGAIYDELFCVNADDDGEESP